MEDFGIGAIVSSVLGFGTSLIQKQEASKAYRRERNLFLMEVAFTQQQQQREERIAAETWQRWSKIIMVGGAVFLAAYALS